MKTINEWLLLLPPAIAKLALENTKRVGTEDDEPEGLSDAIDCMCPWYKSPEGDDYWGAVFDTIRQYEEGDPLHVTRSEYEEVAKQVYDHLHRTNAQTQ